MSVNITKLDYVYTLTKLDNLKFGTFFSYLDKLYIKLCGDVVSSTKIPTCYNLSKQCDSYLALNTCVYLCKDVNITYELLQDIK